MNDPLPVPNAEGRSEPVRTVIVDDHATTREGSRSILERAGGISVVADAADGAEALRAVERHRPDVLVLDLYLPIHLSDISRLGGETVADRVMRVSPRTAILLFTAFPAAAAVRSLLRRGARGIVSKAASGRELVLAVRTVAAGRLFVPPEILDSGPPLTDRERQVLELMAAGAGNAEIATRLTITLNTVETYVHQVFLKLGAKKRIEAVTKARRRGLLGPDP
jgi:DNA-binding NarL/FixJ family response regulator